ncbi:hypothetical protein ACSOLP_002886 [Salmonella enterica subsp. enterica serovar Montevideo]
MTAVRGRHAPTPPPPFPGKAPDTTVYPYPWNKPREAIGVDRASLEDIAAAAREEQARQQLDDDIRLATHELPLFMRMRIEGRIDEECQQKGVYIARLKFRDFVRRELPLLKAVNNTYRVNLENPMPSLWSWMDTSGVTAKHAADLQGLTERFNRLPEYTDEDVELLAQDVAIFIRAEISETDRVAAGLDDHAYGHQLYGAALRIAEHLNQPPRRRGKIPAL